MEWAKRVAQERSADGMEVTAALARAKRRCGRTEFGCWSFREDLRRTVARLATGEWQPVSGHRCSLLGQAVCLTGGFRAAVGQPVPARPWRHARHVQEAWSWSVLASGSRAIHQGDAQSSEHMEGVVESGCWPSPGIDGCNGVARKTRARKPISGRWFMNMQPCSVNPVV